MVEGAFVVALVVVALVVALVVVAFVVAFVVVRGNLPRSPGVPGDFPEVRGRGGDGDRP